MIKTITKQGIILAIAAFFATALVVLTHFVTKDSIALQKQNLRLQSLNEVIAKDLHDNLLTENCTLISDPSLADEPVSAYIATLDGKLTAIAIEAVAPDGYNGDIRILLAADNDNHILGLRVLEHNETPGLGDKVEKKISNWVDSFIGQTLVLQNAAHFAVKKDGGDFDQFTGATITPRAVVKAAKNALWYIKKRRSKILTQPKNCGDAQ